jgi:hypothetical protein
MLWIGMSARRWVLDLVGAAELERLATGLAGSELQSVLLEVMQRRARARAPSELLAQYRRDPFCAPSGVDLRASVAIDAHLLAAAHGFEGLELSPVAPFAVCSAVALTDQNRVPSALRTTEVVSDPTNVLALECAERLLKAPASAVHLATSQRVVRAQPVPKRPGHTQHFRLFVLASAGLEAKDHAFTAQALERHVRTMGSALDLLEQHGYAFGARRVVVLATAERRTLGERIVSALGGSATLQPLEHGYYSGGLRYQLWVTAPDGSELPLVDGGAFDWLGKLTSNRRAVYVASGAGSQLIALRFATPAQGA